MVTSVLPLFAPCYIHPSVAKSLTPEEAARNYDSYASTYDRLDGGAPADILGIDEARSELFRQARGSVLEIGCGTGLNLLKYDFSEVTSLTLLDVSEGMLQEAKQKAMASKSLRDVPIRFVQGDATSELVERFGKESFDSVVDSFSFCVMGTQGAKNCLNQLAQVVKRKSDGGQILLLENARSSNPLLGLYQDGTAETAAAAGGKGCLYNQDVTRMIRETPGAEMIKETRYALGTIRGYQVQVS